MPQVAAPWSVHWFSGSCPAGTDVHVPSVPASAHDAQVPVQAVAQQTPCAQKLCAQSLAIVQAWPSASLPQLPLTQLFVDTQSVLAVQVVLQVGVAVSHRYGSHSEVVTVRQTPAPSQVRCGVSVDPTQVAGRALRGRRPEAARAGAVAHAVRPARRRRRRRALRGGRGRRSVRRRCCTSRGCRRSRTTCTSPCTPGCSSTPARRSRSRTRSPSCTPRRSASACRCPRCRCWARRSPRRPCRWSGRRRRRVAGVRSARAHRRRGADARAVARARRRERRTGAARGRALRAAGVLAARARAVAGAVVPAGRRRRHRALRRDQRRIAGRRSASTSRRCP